MGYPGASLDWLRDLLLLKFIGAFVLLAAPLLLYDLNCRLTFRKALLLTIGYMALSATVIYWVNAQYGENRLDWEIATGLIVAKIMACGSVLAACVLINQMPLEPGGTSRGGEAHDDRLVMVWIVASLLVGLVMFGYSVPLFFARPAYQLGALAILLVPTGVVIWRGEGKIGRELPRSFLLTGLAAIATSAAIALLTVRTNGWIRPHILYVVACGLSALLGLRALYHVTAVGIARVKGLAGALSAIVALNGFWMLAGAGKFWLAAAPDRAQFWLTVALVTLLLALSWANRDLRGPAGR